MSPNPIGRSDAAVVSSSFLTPDVSFGCNIFYPHVGKRFSVYAVTEGRDGRRCISPCRNQIRWPRPGDCAYREPSMDESYQLLRREPLDIQLCKQLWLIKVEPRRAMRCSIIAQPAMIVNNRHKDLDCLPHRRCAEYGSAAVRPVRPRSNQFLASASHIVIHSCAPPSPQYRTPLAECGGRSRPALRQ